MKYEHLNLTGKTELERAAQIETWANRLVDTLNYNQEQIDKIHKEREESHG